MSNLTTLPKGDSAWLLRKSIQRIMQQVSVLETNIGSSTTGNSSNTQVIFNDNGTLRGDAGLTYNAATDTLSAASATITGDLTVRTTGLVVNATGTGVQVSPSAPLCVKTRNSDSVGLRVLQSTGGTSGIQFTDDPVTADWGSVLATSANLFVRSNSLLQLQTGGATERFAISSTGICTWSNVGGVAGTAMTLNSTGLGVGVSPATNSKIHTLGNGNNVYAVFQNGDTLAASKTSQLWLSNGPTFLGANNREYRINNIGTSATAADLVFDYWNGTAIAERMRIDSAGNLLVGTTTNTNGSRVFARGTGGATTLAIQSSTGDTANPGLLVGKFDNDSTTSQILVRFTVNNNSAGSGQINANGASQAAFGSFSDSRLKENILNLPSQLANILSLRPVEFDYKDGSGHQIGFVAQEMQEVYSDAVGEQNGFLTVTGWSKTEARLVSAIKELAAKVQALEAKLA